MMSKKLYFKFLGFINRKKENMKILIFWNEHQKKLLNQYFLPTFYKFNKNDFELVLIEFETKTTNSIFGTIDFRKLMFEKVEKLINFMGNLKSDEFFIVSDIDIQFFGQIKSEIDDNVKLDYDIVFQKEQKNEGINTGFMLIKNNKNVISFWKKILLDLKNHPSGVFINEQKLANDYKDDLKWNVFDDKIWNWSQGGLKKNILLHHANCVITIEDKEKQMEFVKNFIN